MASGHRGVLQIDLIGSPAETDPSALSRIRKRGGQMHGLHITANLVLLWQFHYAVNGGT